MITAPSQQDQFQRIVEPKEGEQPQADDGISPIMPFPTSYILNREQETELVNHCLRRKDSLEQDMGRDVCAGGNWWNSPGIAAHDALGVDSPQATWLGKRVLYDKTFRNEMDFRPTLLGGIFEKTNLVVPAARRICRQMIARAVNYFFGTAPWFAIYPVGALDRVRADQADRYTRWKLDQALLQRTEEQAIGRAFVVGECVTHTDYAKREQIYKTTARVLVDAAGLDILGADGDYITEKDKWIQDSVTDPATGIQTMADLFVLERDGITPQPEGEMIWAEKLITRRIVHYRGPQAKIINFMDFLCPLDAPSIQEADCCLWIYDMPVMTLADQWKKAIPKNATAEEQFEANRRAVEMLRMIGGAHGFERSTSGQNSSVVDSATQNLRGDQTQPIVKIGEFHIRYDADGDGLLEDVMVVIDLTTRTPIFYDYEANVTPDGLRPFTVTRINEVPGRWYGLGAMEMFQTSQEIIDLWMNRKNFASSSSGRVTFWDPSRTLEGKANPHLQLNGGMTYTLNTGEKAEECLSVVYLDDNKAEELQQLIEFFMQLMMNESGIANANDGNVAGMDSTKLATGIRNIEKSGQELFGLYLGDLEPGVSETLSKMVKILFANLDEMEVYRYFETGEAKQDPLTGTITSGEGVQGMVEIDPGDLVNLEINTKVLLTRRRGEQVIESGARIIELVDKFFSFAYEIQLVIAPTFIEMAKQYQCPDAQKLFIPTQVPIAGPSGAISGAPPTSHPRQATPNL